METLKGCLKDQGRLYYKIIFILFTYPNIENYYGRASSFIISPFLGEMNYCMPKSYVAAERLPTHDGPSLQMSAIKNVVKTQHQAVKLKGEYIHMKRLSLMFLDILKIHYILLIIPAFFLIWCFRGTACTYNQYNLSPIPKVPCRWNVWHIY